MNTESRTGIVYSLAGAALLAAATGCSATETGARSTSPPFALGATSDVTWGSAACTPEGMPTVLATHVAPKGIRAISDGTHVWLRFGTRGLPRTAREIDVHTLEWADSDEPPAEGAAPSALGIRMPGDRSLLGWTDGSIERGMSAKLATLDAHSVLLHEPMELGSEGSAVGMPAVAVATGGRSLLAWTDGSIERGMSVKLATLDAQGVSLREPIELGSQGSAIGMPAVAVATDGHGILAFIESNGYGFQVVATRVVCAPD